MKPSFGGLRNPLRNLRWYGYPQRASAVIGVSLGCPLAKSLANSLHRPRKANAEILNELPSYYQPLPRQTQRKNGNFYRVLGIGCRNYCHFLHEVVMPLARVAPHLPPDTRLLVPENMAPHLRDVLDALGLGFDAFPSRITSCGSWKGSIS